MPERLLLENPDQVATKMDCLHGNTNLYNLANKKHNLTHYSVVVSLAVNF